MPLSCVTITGSDDSTDPINLFELWQEFPFVEWGILISSNVRSRFPSTGWIQRLIEQRERSDNLMRLSLHVCGKYMRELEQGHSTLFEALGQLLFAFKRVQLNCNGHQKSHTEAKHVAMALQSLKSLSLDAWNPTVIFQWRDFPDNFYEPTSKRFDCVGLFDGSGGRGTLPPEWPDQSIGIPCGWAGGLGPYNLEKELPRIDVKASSLMHYWIDMESKVRTADRSMINMHAVSRCLEIAEPVVEAGILAKLKKLEAT